MNTEAIENQRLIDGIMEILIETHGIPATLDIEMRNITSHAGTRQRRKVFQNLRSQAHQIMTLNIQTEVPTELKMLATSITRLVKK